MGDYLKKQIEFEEGRRLQKYKCTAGHWTIGVGHNLDARPFYNREKIPDVIDDALCDAIFDDDLSRTINDLADLWSGFQLLSGARQDAVVNMAFQMGVGGVMKFKRMLDAMAKCDWHKAADEALNSQWARQTPARAERVAGQIRTGDYYTCF